MSALTLTIPMNEEKPDNSLVTFSFKRDVDGRGGWSTDTPMGGLPPNCIVHTELSQDLSTIARERKLTEIHNFAPYPPKPVQPTDEEKKAARKARKAARKSAPKVPPLMASFNPFDR